MKDLLEVIEEGREDLNKGLSENTDGRWYEDYEINQNNLKNHLTSHTKAILTNMIKRMKGEMKPVSKVQSILSKKKIDSKGVKKEINPMLIHNKTLQTQIDYLEDVLKKL